MSMNDLVPDWASKTIVEDEYFALAYDEVSDFNRALLKTAIARLYAWHSPGATLSQVHTQRWDGGFESRKASTPREFAFFFIDQSYPSPVKTLAAIMPAVTAGVREIAVIHISNDPLPASMLTALELAGIENVMVMCPDDARKLAAHLASSKLSGIIGLAPGCQDILPANATWGRVVVWILQGGTKAGIWLESEDEFDFQAMAFCHPDTEFEVWGVEADLPESGFIKWDGTQEDFLSRGYDVIYASEAGIREKAHLGFGVGQEWCWVWPELGDGMFMYECIEWK